MGIRLSGYLNLGIHDIRCKRLIIDVITNHHHCVLTCPVWTLNLYNLRPGLFDTPGDLLGVNDGAIIIHDTGTSVKPYKNLG